jgi:negative regulator of sigma-B (phosphoserine phosphatase)
MGSLSRYSKSSGIDPAAQSARSFTIRAILPAVRLDASIHGRPKIGESCSGDAGLVVPLEDVTWVLLVDALGHGPKAHEVARMAVDEAAKFDVDHGVEDGLQRLHERLRGSRGAAATLARFDPTGATFCGVGNVEVRGLGGFDMPFAPSSGVLGGRMRRPRAVRVELPTRTRLLFYTDGVARRAPFDSLATLDGTTACTTLLDHHSHLHDDATVIHVTYLPSSPR